MSTPNLRPPMRPVAPRVRAYFAPVTRATSAPTIFDPAATGMFPLDAPPAPWLDLGWIADFRRTLATAIAAARGGPKGAALSQFRQRMETRVDFQFREWGKLQMALAGGSQHMNVLAAQAAAPLEPWGGTPLTAVPVLAGSTSSQVVVGATAVAGFVAGDAIAVDAAYTGQTGYVGAGLAAAYVRSAADVGNHADYIRRVTFNVARVAALTSDSLLLAQPLIAGAPPAGWGVQKVVGFVDREAGSFFQEWSALFVFDAQSGGRVCFYYPRLQPAQPQPPAEPAGEARFALAEPWQGLALRAAFTALPYGDARDGEQVLCYRSYFPPAAAALY